MAQSPAQHLCPCSQQQGSKRQCWDSVQVMELQMGLSPRLRFASKPPDLFSLGSRATHGQQGQSCAQGCCKHRGAAPPTNRCPQLRPRHPSSSLPLPLILLFKCRIQPSPTPTACFPGGRAVSRLSKPPAPEPDTHTGASFRRGANAAAGPKAPSQVRAALGKS